VNAERETNWFKLLKFPLSIVWYAIVGLAAVVAIWFVVDLVHISWQLSFSNVGKIIAPSLITDAIPEKAGWILIAAGSVLAVQINRVRDNFIRDLAKAIREGPQGNPFDAV
jgi:cell division protein FtsX